MQRTTEPFEKLEGRPLALLAPHSLRPPGFIRCASSRKERDWLVREKIEILFSGFGIKPR
jgi:hypothetical protein